MDARDKLACSEAGARAGRAECGSCFRHSCERGAGV